MPTIKPFDAGGWFPIHNHVFDVIMPTLSPNGWKVLCVAIRQTWGWRAEGDPTGRERREWDRISYSQFREKAGIASDATVRRALQECIEARYILRRQVGTHPGTNKPLYTYALNRDYEAETTTETVEAAATTVSVVAPTTETVEAATTETVDTKQRKTNKQSVGGGGFSEEQQQALDALTGLDVETSIAHRLAGTCDPGQVLGWVDYARRARGLDNPPAFVVARLQAGEPPPPAGDSTEEGGDYWRAMVLRKQREREAGG